MLWPFYISYNSEKIKKNKKRLQIYEKSKNIAQKINREKERVLVD